MFHVNGSLAREDAYAILSSLVVDGRGIGGVHVGVLGYLAQDVSLAAASSHAVDLLHGYCVWRFTDDDVGDALAVEHVVHAFGIPDVVAHQSQVAVAVWFRAVL